MLIQTRVIILFHTNGKLNCQVKCKTPVASRGENEAGHNNMGHHIYTSTTRSKISYILICIAFCLEDLRKIEICIYPACRQFQCLILHVQNMPKKLVYTYLNEEQTSSLLKQVKRYSTLIFYHPSY